ncbi:MAG: hypothetical protein IMW86_00895 [Hydrogenibacillus sp.]|nr:hypothetical protein [Hydrogenibacillus sp.]
MAAYGQPTNPMLRARFRLTRVYMGTALVFMLSAWLVMITAARPLAQGQMWAPSILGATHFFVLGYVLMTIQGAIMQITPVVFQGRLYSISLGYVQYVLMVLGSAGMGTSFLLGWTGGLGIFGSLILLALLLLFWNLARTLQQVQKKRDALRVLGAGIFLLWTVLLGLSFVAHGFISATVQSLMMHVTSGVVGGFTTLIVLLSPRLMTFFVSSRHKSTERFIRRSEGLLYLGLIFILSSPILEAGASGANLGLGAWTVIGRLGWVIYLAGYALVLYRLYRHVQGRRRPQMEWILAWILGGLFGGWPLLGLWALAGQNGFQPPYGAGLLLFVFGYVQWMVAAYMAKIMPFLRWMSRFDPTINPAIREKPRVTLPSMRAVMPKGLTIASLLAFLLGASGLSAGHLLAHATLAAIGALLGSLGSVCLILAVAIMYRRTRV